MSEILVFTVMDVPNQVWRVIIHDDGREYISRAGYELQEEAEEQKQQLEAKLQEGRK